eukprot:6206358-Pleurochrysis_carterae.AAC.1
MHTGIQWQRETEEEVPRSAHAGTCLLTRRQHWRAQLRARIYARESAHAHTQNKHARTAKSRDFKPLPYWKSQRGA